MFCGIADSVKSVSLEGLVSDGITKGTDPLKGKNEEGVEIDIPADSLVSMNLWGFHPHLFTLLQEGFDAFVQKNFQKIVRFQFTILKSQMEINLEIQICQVDYCKFNQSHKDIFKFLLTIKWYIKINSRTILIIYKLLTF